MRFFPVFCLTLTLLPGTRFAHALESLPQTLYPGLEYLLQVADAGIPFTPDQIMPLVTFVTSTPEGASLSMQERDGATGAFHSFVLHSDLARIIDYAYNPHIPIYATMPSSISDQEWLSPDVRKALGQLPEALASGQTTLVRGLETETITPDANTGGYYTYQQKRAVAVFQGPKGPVLMSISFQDKPSEVGRKGYVVGEDADWNYLYSQEKGLTKTGLGWVSSYMYKASSILIFAADEQTGVVRAGSFKWLRAGWAGMNMVRQSHILGGIERFAAGLKTVLESPRLPPVTELASIYQNLLTETTDDLRLMVRPYVDSLAHQKAGKLVSPFTELLTSGTYLHGMSEQEMIRILFLEFLKARLGQMSFVPLTQYEKMAPAQP